MNNTRSRFKEQNLQQAYLEGYNDAIAKLGAELCPPFQQKYLAKIFGYGKSRFSQLVSAEQKRRELGE